MTLATSNVNDTYREKEANLKKDQTFELILQQSGLMDKINGKSC